MNPSSLKELAEAATPGQDCGLYPRLPEPLRSHAHFIKGALSHYDGGPASEDVRAAWERIVEALARLIANHRIYEHDTQTIGDVIPLEDGDNANDPPRTLVRLATEILQTSRKP